MLRLLSLFSACAFLLACAATPTAPTAQPVAAALEAPKPLEKPIPANSVYPLLVAEFALRRRDYDVALDTYMEQARLLDDAGVRSHATRLAQFMHRDPETLEAAQLWVQAQPESVEANNTLATLLTRRGSALEALPYFAVVTRAGDKAQYPLALNGFRELDPTAQEALMAAIDGLAVEFPNDIQLLITRALIRDELGQDRQARELLEQVFTQEPYQPQAVLLEAKILFDSKAADPFARLEAALADSPDDKRLRLQYARLLTQTDIEAAREQFQLMSNQSPRDGDLLFSLALISREMGDDAGAKNYLQQLLALGQRIDEAHYYLGRIAEDEGALNEAVAEYMLVEAGGEFLNANLRIGYILLGADKGPDYHRYMNQLRTNNPEIREQLYGMEIDLLTRANNVNAAMVVATNALVAFPQSTALRYSRSLLAEQQNDLVLMESDLRTIIDEDPENATALNALGYSLSNRTQRYDEAHALIARALQLQPGEPAILDSMGWVLYRQGSYQDALKYLNEAYAKFPDPEVAAHLGEVLWQSGDRATAINIWRSALIKDPEHGILRETLERLEVTELAGEPQ